MKLINKVLVSLILGGSILPSFAKIDGGISQNYFYDTEQTIMTEVPLNKTLKTGKYWEKNLLYFNKYRPLFMLSNKELYALMPKEHVSVVQRISTPSVYTVSLKTASIKTVSFNQIETPKNISMPKIISKPVVKTIEKVNPTTSTLMSQYEQAKNPEADIDFKIDTAILLKDSKNPSNYNLAIDLLDDVIRIEPYNAYAFYIKGELYSIKRDSENAMKNYVEALKINPTSKQCCLGIAKILEPTNKELAQKYYNRAK